MRLPRPVNNLPIKGIENLEEMLNIGGIDVTIIGPYDLSGSLGYPGEFEHLQFKAAIERIHQISKEMNALMGTHVVMPDVSTVKKRIDEGYRFIAYGIDTLFLGQCCRNGLKALADRIRDLTCFDE